MPNLSLDVGDAAELAAIKGPPPSTPPSLAGRTPPGRLRAASDDTTAEQPNATSRSRL